MKKTLLSLLSILFTLSASSQIPELWGSMALGGPFGIGGIIKINGDGTGYNMDYVCTGGVNGGSIQSNLLPISSTLIYGNSTSGGLNSVGDIYSYNPGTNNYTMLYSMDSLSGYYPRGPIIKASNNNSLFGMTNNGGLFDKGVFYDFNLTNNTYTKRHDFDVLSGQLPNGGVMQSTVNNKIYGMTTSGGTNSGGVIFSYDIPTTTFSIVHDFSFFTGWTPFGTLRQASNGLLYGLAFGGGAGGYGVIFSLDPTNNNYNVVHSFNGTDGSAPWCQLIEVGGILYGCTTQGGINNNKGVIFKYQISNNTMTKLHDFDTPTGASPYGNVMMASDGNLYGMTASGGANSLGVIYKFDLTTNTYSVIYTGSFATGGIPYADLIEYSGATPVNEIDKMENRISISPNPTSGTINIQVNNFTKSTTLILTNVLGQEVMQIPLTVPALQMNLDLPAGLYFYTAASSSSRSAGRLVVE